MVDSTSCGLLLVPVLAIIAESAFSDMLGQVSEILQASHRVTIVESQTLSIGLAALSMMAMSAVKQWHQDATRRESRTMSFGELVEPDAHELLLRDHPRQARERQRDGTK